MSQEASGSKRSFFRKTEKRGGFFSSNVGGEECEGPGLKTLQSKGLGCYRKKGGKNRLQKSEKAQVKKNLVHDECHVYLDLSPSEIRGYGWVLGGRESDRAIRGRKN